MTYRVVSCTGLLYPKYLLVDEDASNAVPGDMAFSDDKAAYRASKLLELVDKACVGAPKKRERIFWMLMDMEGLTKYMEPSFSGTTYPPGCRMLSYLGDDCYALEDERGRIWIRQGVKGSSFTPGRSCYDSVADAKEAVAIGVCARKLAPDDLYEQTRIFFQLMQAFERYSSERFRDSESN